LLHFVACGEDQKIMIYDNTGRRKYLTRVERDSFIRATYKLSPEARAFCLTLVFTGARLSEVLSLSPDSFDAEAGIVVIECLKKRRPGVFRAVPIPDFFFAELEKINKRSKRSGSVRIWTWGRTTAWSLVKETMRMAGIANSYATPRALRHTFGVIATQSNVPLNTLQKWMGHSRLTTTAIYANAVGLEERRLASRMWVSTRPL